MHPLVIGAVDRAESLSILLCRELLCFHIADEARAHEIAATLNTKYTSHSYPILLPEAKKIDLNAEPLPLPVNALLLELNDNSGWRRIERRKGKIHKSAMHVA